MDAAKDKRSDAAEGVEQEVVMPKSHHYAAPEVEEWKPHPYEEQGVGRRESLKGELPEQKAHGGDEAADAHKK